MKQIAKQSIGPTEKSFWPWLAQALKLSLSPKPNYLVLRTTLKKLLIWRTIYAGGFGNSETYVDFWWKRTKDVIEFYWEAVQVIAKALPESRILRYQETRRLIREALGGVIPRVELL